MSVRSFLHVDTNIIDLENIQEMKIIQSPNDHGYLYLQASLQQDSQTEYLLTAKAYEPIEIVYLPEEDAEIPLTLFKGIVQNMKITAQENVYQLFIKAATGSYKADIQKKSRSFQDRNATYESLVKGVLYEYDFGDAADEAFSSETTGEFILQYKETDWQFVKRLASRFHVPLVPLLISDTPQITIGIPYGNDLGQLERFNYHLTKNLERYLLINANEGDSFSELDALDFCIETSENFEIGDKLSFTDFGEERRVESLIINHKEAEFRDNVLTFKYKISTEKGFYVQQIYNEQITGLSLMGKVMERVQDTVIVDFEIDKNDTFDLSKGWNFPYSTPYTAEGSAGWYVMPEIGDTVLIYFPNKEEKYGMGMNSIRVSNTGTDKIGNPEVKYLRTADGKEIRLSPKELAITCSNWTNEETGEENIIYIKLDESAGIEIQSTKPIHITSDADINITADKNIQILAEEEIRLKCSSSLIQMDGGVAISGTSVLAN